MHNNLNLDRLAAKWAQQITNVIGKEYGRKGNEKKRKTVGADEVDTFSTKALGVLQENGVYAAMLFLHSRSGEKLRKETDFTSDEKVDAEEMIACHIIAGLLNLLRETNLLTDEERKALPGGDGKIEWNKINALKDKTLGFYVDLVAEDLDRLLLVKDLYEQTLIYVRFGAKAAKVET